MRKCYFLSILDLFYPLWSIFTKNTTIKEIWTLSARLIRNMISRGILSTYKCRWNLNYLFITEWILTTFFMVYGHIGSKYVVIIVHFKYFLFILIIPELLRIILATMIIDWLWYCLYSLLRKAIYKAHWCVNDCTCYCSIYYEFPMNSKWNLPSDYFSDFSFPRILLSW